MCIYRFDGWDEQEQYPATCEYLPMLELKFDSDGSFLMAEKEGNSIFIDVLAQLGLEMNGTAIPSQALSQFEKLLVTVEGQKKIIEIYLASYIKTLSPTERQEFVDVLKSIQSVGPILDPTPTTAEVIQSIQDADTMEKLAEKRQRKPSEKLNQENCQIM